MKINRQVQARGSQVHQALVTKMTKIKIVRLSTFLVLLSSGGYSLNSYGSNSEDEQKTDSSSSRSLSVEYEAAVPIANTNRYDSNANDAQHSSLIALKQIAQEATARQTREQVIAQRQEKYLRKSDALNNSSLFRKKTTEHKATENSQNQKSQTDYYAPATYYVEFDIYDASTRLFEDFDYDGFFQTFSVTFDADVHSQYVGERARVFADLYLSRNGGPWELYFTTDDFTIVDDSSEDSFEVMTTLDQGHHTDHYDVLIDLYEVGYSDIVATISSEELDALYALPLESADRDEYVVPQQQYSEVSISAGSMSMFSVLGLIFAIAVRARKVEK